MRPVALLVGSVQLRRALRGTASADGAAGWLVRGWGNPRYAASPELLASVIRATQVADAPIVECGSGVTSVVLAAAHKHLGTRVVSLEHDPRWASTVRRRLKHLGHRHEFLLHRPLEAGERADWYSVLPGDLPAQIGVLLCDGPPASTRGGRLGVLQAIVETSPTIVIIDDVERPAETELCRQVENLGYSIVDRTTGPGSSHAVLRHSPGRAPQTPAP